MGNFIRTLVRRLGWCPNWSRIDDPYADTMVIKNDRFFTFIDGRLIEEITRDWGAAAVFPDE